MITFKFCNKSRLDNSAARATRGKTGSSIRAFCMIIAMHEKGMDKSTIEGFTFDVFYKVNFK